MVNDLTATDDADGQLLVTISEAGADPERLDELTLLLRSDLIELGNDVRPPRAGEAPAGTRGLELATAGALLVALKGSAESVGAIVSAVRAWLKRGSSPRAVELTVAGATLRLDAATEHQQQQLVDEFVDAIRRT